MQDNLQKYNNVSGVWAIRGKLRQKNTWCWFNVAKIKDIKDEVDEDILFMSKDFANPIVKVKYVTKWNVSYEYEDYKYPQRRVSVWKLIGEIIRNECDEVEILCIAKSPEEKDLGKIERYFGFYTQAEFWSDKIHYKVEKEEMQSRIKEYLEGNKIEDYFKDKEFKIIYKESSDDSAKRIF